MKKTVIPLFALLLFGVSCPTAFAIDSSVLRDIRRADTVQELVSLAQKVLEDVAMPISPEPEKVVMMNSDANLYLQYIRIRMDALVSEKHDKQHKELIAALGKK